MPTTGFNSTSATATGRRLLASSSVIPLVMTQQLLLGGGVDTPSSDLLGSVTAMQTEMGESFTDLLGVSTVAASLEFVPESMPPPDNAGGNHVKYPCVNALDIPVCGPWTDQDSDHIAAMKVQ